MPLINPCIVVHLLRLGARESIAIARTKGKLNGRAPQLSPPRLAHLVKLDAVGEHSIADMAEFVRGLPRHRVPAVLNRANAVTAR